MSSPTKNFVPVSVKVKKLNSAIPIPVFLKAQVLNAGDTGLPQSPVLTFCPDIKHSEVGPRLLRFLEMPILVIDLESDVNPTKPETPQKRKRRE
jgi:hypothetical protein